LSEAEVYELRQEVGSLTQKLATAEALATSRVGEERARIEQEVLNDLADHPTVEYIKRIEDERAYYKEQLAEEVRRCKDLRVAVDAKQRMIDKLATSSRPGTGMNTTIRSSTAGQSRNLSRQSAH